MTGHEKTLNTAVAAYKCYQKEIDWLKEKSQFDKYFSMQGVVTEYNVFYGKLSDHVPEAWERYPAHAEA